MQQDGQSAAAQGAAADQPQGQTERQGDRRRHHRQGRIGTCHGDAVADREVMLGTEGARAQARAACAQVLDHAAGHQPHGAAGALQAQRIFGVVVTEEKAALGHADLGNGAGRHQETDKGSGIDAAGRAFVGGARQRHFDSGRQVVAAPVAQRDVAEFAYRAAQGANGVIGSGGDARNRDCVRDLFTTRAGDYADSCVGTGTGTGSDTVTTAVERFEQLRQRIRPRHRVVVEQPDPVVTGRERVRHAHGKAAGAAEVDLGTQQRHRILAAGGAAAVFKAAAANAPNARDFARHAGRLAAIVDDINGIQRPGLGAQRGQRLQQQLRTVVSDEDGGDTHGTRSFPVQARARRRASPAASRRTG
jgi:hypothetical protein